MTRAVEGPEVHLRQNQTKLAKPDIKQVSEPQWIKAVLSPGTNSVLGSCPGVLMLPGQGSELILKDIALDQLDLQAVSEPEQMNLEAVPLQYLLVVRFRTSIKPVAS
ncbi:hypothetical protein CHARACLAT_010319 [Characodon lateralis]|uniref:Uncharacterized protein n=1 Tax=Characodon lateralis TaxID=208331 RepID=A0ABU7E3F6_9TELE|nr:hypothetical protein [Characodon lateralis]